MSSQPASVLEQNVTEHFTSDGCSRMARVTQYHSETTNAWLHVHPAVEKSLGTPGPMRVCSWAPGTELIFEGSKPLAQKNSVRVPAVLSDRPSPLVARASHYRRKPLPVVGEGICASHEIGVC